MTLQELNALPKSIAMEALTKCCGASRWVSCMEVLRPFENEQKLLTAASDCWYALSQKDWLEAFAHHPKIGDTADLEKKFSATKEWAGQEQGAVRTAGKLTVERMALLNREYEIKFGYIFIVCATGKSVQEMVSIIEERLHHHAEQEIITAMEEQNKITAIRLKKLLS
jgi:2-oxo-4-hydroxy-4-carboxy-5-ureidoimidazoline decarboxylase